MTAALTGADLLDIFRFLPAAITTLCIPLVYWFARDLLGERPLAALAALIYALLPRSYIFLIMGGGITRAWGHLFMLLTAWMALRAFTHPQRRWAALAGLSGALTVLSHPEAAMHAAAFGPLHLSIRSASFSTLILNPYTPLLDDNDYTTSIPCIYR